MVCCGRLDDRVYAAACDIDVCTAGVGTVGCDFNIARGVRFDAGVDALCVGVDFLFFVFLPCFYGSGKAWSLYYKRLSVIIIVVVVVGVGVCAL